MSQDNVEVVKRAHPDGVDLVQLFRDFTAPDAPGAGIDLTAYESECQVAFNSRRTAALDRRPPPAFSDSRKGGAIGLSPGRAYYIEVEEFIDGGDEIVSLARVRAQSARGGVPVEHTPAAVWSVRAGKVVGVLFSCSATRLSKPPGCGSSLAA